MFFLCFLFCFVFLSWLKQSIHFSFSRMSEGREGKFNFPLQHQRKYVFCFALMVLYFIFFIILFGSLPCPLFILSLNVAESTSISTGFLPQKKKKRCGRFFFFPQSPHLCVLAGVLPGCQHCLVRLRLREGETRSSEDWLRAHACTANLALTHPAQMCRRFCWRRLCVCVCIRK